MPNVAERLSCVARFLNERSGAFSLEMGILAAPVVMGALFVFDVSRAHIVASSLDGAAIQLLTAARNGKLDTVTKDDFCEDFNLSFCRMDKIGVRIGPLQTQESSGGPAPGEFSINPPAGKAAILIQIQQNLDPVINFTGSSGPFVVSAGGFTHVN